VQDFTNQQEGIFLRFLIEYAPIAQLIRIAAGDDSARSNQDMRNLT